MIKKTQILKMLEKLLKIHTFTELPHGVNVFEDLKLLKPIFQPKVIFDVGANIGQSAREMKMYYPKASVYCFEPVKSTFQQLQEALKDLSNIHCYQLALGSSNQTAFIKEGNTSDKNQIVINAEGQSQQANGEEVKIFTLDDFCRQEKIERIHFLKIDTEGFDFEVLKGADQFLREDAIDIVQVETGMNPGNHVHVAFETIKDHLATKLYSLFGIYEQVEEWPTSSPQLRRVNAVFISSRIISEYKYYVVRT